MAFLVEEVRNLKDVDEILTSLKGSCPEEESLFRGYEWQKAWCETFGVGKKIRFLKVSEDSQPIALFPLIVSREYRRPWFSLHHVYKDDLQFLSSKCKIACVLPVNQLSIAANIQSGTVRGGWHVKAGREEKALSALLDYLRKKKDWDVIVLPGIPSEEAALYRQVLNREGLPFYVNPEKRPLFSLTVKSWEEYFAGRKRHFRTRFKTAIKELQRMGEVRSCTVTSKEDVAEALSALFALGHKSWKERPRTGSSFYLPLTDQTKAFYSRLAELYLERELCAVHQVFVDDVLAASMFSIRENGRLFTLQTFYAPEFAKASPGRFLMKETIDWSANNGIKQIDFNGNSSIVRLMSKESAQYCQVLVFSNRLYSRIIYKCMQFVDKVKNRLGSTDPRE